MVHLVRGAAAAVAAAMTVAVEAVDLEDADTFDLLHRLDALAYDALDAVQQLPAEQRVPRLVGQHVLGLVEHPLRFGLDGRTAAFGPCRDPGPLRLLLRQPNLDGPASL